MKLTRFISATIEAGKRILKTSGSGRNATDTRSAYESAPAGFDSVPLPQQKTVYVQMERDATPIIIGHINESQVAEVGERRIYSQDNNGNILFEFWLKTDGSMYLNGDADNLVRFAALKTGLDTYFNSLNLAIAAGVTSAGGAYTPPSTPLNITAAKITEITTT